MIYFDNAATSWPKPPGVGKAMTQFLDEVGANPGRAAHRLAIESGRIVHAAREAVTKVVHAGDPLQVAFCSNVTEALNVALVGYLRSGDHVVTSGMEHNAVMRPLRALEREGVELTVVPCSREGVLEPAKVGDAIRPNTAMIVLNHASNVTGTLLPVADVGRIARDRGLVLLVDAAQTAGAYPINAQADCIDLLAFTGHKSLYGPMGTGGLVVGDRVDLGRLSPLKRGGTGSRSELEEQPDFMPDMLESGTLNVVGLAGLQAGVGWVLGRGIEVIRTHEVEMTARLLAGLLSTPGVTVFGTGDAESQTATVSFTIDGVSASEAGLLLDEEHGVLCRVGLHCSPAAHRTIGTFPTGTIRFGLGSTTTSDQVDAGLDAVRVLYKASA